jgi:hypothetical protein
VAGGAVTDDLVIRLEPNFFGHELRCRSISHCLNHIRKWSECWAASGKRQEALGSVLVAQGSVGRLRTPCDFCLLYAFDAAVGSPLGQPRRYSALAGQRCRRWGGIGLVAP